MVKSFFNFKKMLFLGVILVFILLSYNIIRNSMSVWQRQYVIEQAERELERVKKENASLKSQIEGVNKPGFIEEQARNKLFYVKPGEQIVYVPTKEIVKKDVEIVRLSPFREWIALFF